MPQPKSYRTIEEFQREELRPQYKVGFSFDDLMQETMLNGSDLLFDDQVDEFEVGVKPLGGNVVHPSGDLLAVAVGAGAADDDADPGHLMLLVVSWPRRAASDGGGLA